MSNYVHIIKSVRRNRGPFDAHDTLKVEFATLSQSVADDFCKEHNSYVSATRIYAYDSVELRK